MAQAQVNNEEIQIMTMDEKQKRKVNMCVGDQQYVTVFKTDEQGTAINIRKGTRSVTISKDFLSKIYDLKEIILLCCSFVDGDKLNANE